MKQLLICIQLLFTFIVFGQIDNSDWSFVGPISENLENSNLFETGKLEFLAEHPTDPLIIAVGGYQAGLWITYDGAENWENISTIPTGTNGISSLQFDNNGDLLVSNFVEPREPTILLAYTFGMYRYEISSGDWFSLGNIPIVDDKYVVNAISTHPTDNMLKFAGTTRGLFRSDDGGINWTLVPSAEYRIRQVKFAYNNNTNLYDVYASGTDMDIASASGYELLKCVAGTDFDRGPLLMRSKDEGMNFIELTSYSNEVRSDHLENHIFSTIFCFGAPEHENEMVIYTLCATKSPTETSDYNTIHEIKVDTDANTHTVEYLNRQYQTSAFYIADPGRMGIGYFKSTNTLYLGVTRPYDLNVTTKALTGHGYSYGTYSVNSNTVHADLHEVIVSKFDPSKLYVVSDGGFYEIEESDPTYATFKNKGLNIADINGFSGASHDPNYYAMGLFHIVHTSFYDQSTGRNEYTIKTHENDGALINAFNNNLIIFDQQSHNNIIYVCDDGDPTTYSSSALPGQTDFGNPFLIQDPFRERLYAGLRAQMGITEFDQTTNIFPEYKSRIAFAGYWPVPAEKAYGNTIRRMSFSRTDENSVYLTTATPYHNGDDAFHMPYVIKYVGNNFDDMQLGPLEHEDNAGNRQWENITPDWVGGSNLGAGFNSIAPDQLRKVFYGDIAQSNIDNDIAYLANMNVPENEYAKVVKYEMGKWTNYGHGIPENEHPLTMIIDPISNDGLYLITELGLYYRDATMDNWMKYNNGLPQVYATQMEINDFERTIRAGTYGRGIWKSGLKCPENIAYNESGLYATNTVIEGKTINSVATASTDNFVGYKANTRIELNPGFSTQPDALFEGIIESCGEGGPLVDEPIEEIEDMRPGGSSDTDSGLIEEQRSLIKAYPNPSAGVIIIELGADETFDENSRYQVRSMSGALITEGPINTSKFEIDLSTAQNGLYSLTILLPKRSKNFNIAVQ